MLAGARVLLLLDICYYFPSTSLAVLRRCRLSQDFPWLLRRSKTARSYKKHVTVSMAFRLPGMEIARRLTQHPCDSCVFYSLGGLYRGLYRVPCMGLTKGDTRSLDYGSYNPKICLIIT